jgi:hypothetical protein
MYVYVLEPPTPAPFSKKNHRRVHNKSLMG